MAQFYVYAIVGICAILAMLVLIGKLHSKPFPRCKHPSPLQKDLERELTAIREEMDLIAKAQGESGELESRSAILKLATRQALGSPFQPPWSLAQLERRRAIIEIEKRLRK